VSYTIRSAAWAEEGNRSALLQTAEAGAVVAHLGNAAVWLAFMEWASTPGNTVAPFVAPEKRAKKTRVEIDADIKGLKSADRDTLLSALLAERLASDPQWAKGLGVNVEGDQKA
jgi:hypothetical protein